MNCQNLQKDGGEVGASISLSIINQLRVGDTWMEVLVILG